MPKVTEEHLEAKRQQILHSAIACFARDGFHKTTMSDIAQMAGVSDGLAYRYFSGKDEIIREAIRMATGTQGVSDIESMDDDDVAAMITLLFQSSFRRFDIPERRTTVGLRLRSWAEAIESDDVRERVVARWHDYGLIGEQVWADAREQGSMPSDLNVEGLGRVMMAIHDGLDLQWALDPTLDLDACHEAVMQVIAALLGAAQG
jgi:AcrR family transcriptional regulator